MEQHIEKLAEKVALLPGIGRRGSLTLALYMLNHPQIALDISKSIASCVSNVKSCPCCNLISDKRNPKCHICADEKRIKTLCIVRNYKDMLKVEASSSYRGYYFLLKGLMSPIDNIGPKESGIEQLLQVIKDRKMQEILLFLPNTAEGIATGYYLKDQFRKQNLGVIVTKPQVGIPLSGGLGFLDTDTLAYALQKRVEDK